MIELTQQNYYDKATDYEYMSFSLFKNFLANPARAMADLKDEYPWFDDNKALLVGNYLHSYFEGKEAHQKFIDANPELFSTRGASKGQLKTDFMLAQQMIDRLLAEPQFVASIDRAVDREVIVTGTINEVPWKGKIDALDVENGLFYDFKTVKSLVDDGAVWDNEKRERVTFIQSRRYDMQMAIYSELLQQQYGKEFTPVIWAVSKDKKEQLAKPYIITEATMEEALDDVINLQQDVLDYINGSKQPELVDDGSPFYNKVHRVTNQSDYKMI